MRIKENLEATVQRSELIAPADGILVAVSGGPDSVALLHVLNGLREELHLSLEAAHLQHGIRGADAADDAQFVRRLAERLKLPFHLKELNLPHLKTEAGKGNLEELARAERYKFFAAVAAERGLGKIATAHTQDDQAETVLMWLLRGCGMTGLGGMSPVRRVLPADGAAKELVVIRPFLEVSKAEILRYLEAREISYRRDATNSDLSLLRNWIRLELLPVLESRAGARLSARLSRQAELFRDENEYLDALAAHDLREMQRLSGREGLNRREFVCRHPAMQRRVMRLWIAQTRGHLRAIDHVHIEKLVRLIAWGPPQARLPIPGGWELVTEYGIVRLEKRCPNREGIWYSYHLQIGQRLKIPEAGIEMISEHIASPISGYPKTLDEAVFDAAALRGTLTIRNFRRGDRFRPLGLSGHKKVKDLFIEKKIPRSVRARLPLLLAGDDILWIPGYSRSDVGKISTQTRKIARLTAVRFTR
jgi:tRNA(Ile)-lysidine synthase